MTNGPEAYLSGAVRLREQAHRCTVLVGIAALLVLGTAPILVHHLARDADALLAGTDHLGAVCLLALHLLLAPVHEGFHAVLGAGLVFAAWDRARAWVALRRTLAALEFRRPIPGDPFWNAAAASGVNPRVVRVCEVLPNPAFTAGMLRPRIFVSRALASHLSAPELAAVIAHEGAHAARRDPLRLSAARFLASFLFWLPALRRLVDDLADDAEVRADDAAARTQPLVLASALLRIAEAFRPLPQGAPGPAGLTVGACRPGADDLLVRRVRRLAGEEAPIATHVTHRAIGLAALALCLGMASGIAVAHPMPPRDHAGVREHCDHRHASAISHLLCRRPAQPPSAACPHAGR